MIEKPVDNHTFICQFVGTIFTSVFPVSLSSLDITKFRVTAIIVVQKVQQRLPTSTEMCR